MDAREEWLIAHTFFCRSLSARITPEQCRINKGAVGRNEVWACKKCKDFNLVQKEVLPMAISENVRIETIAALRSSQNQSQAARVLKITQPALYWRIMQDKEIHAVADELGFMRKKAHATELPGPKATGGGAMRKQSSISEKPAPEATPRGELTKPANNISGESTTPATGIPDKPTTGIVVDPATREVEISIKIRCSLDKIHQVVDALNYLAV